MNRLLTALLIVALPFSALARDGDYSGSWSDYQEVGILANCSDAPINAAVTCGGTGGIKTEKYNALTLEILYTRSAGTGYQFYLETCHEGHTDTDCTAAGDWYVVATDRTVLGVGTTLSPDPFVRVVSATDRLTYTLGIDYKRVRLNGMISTGTPGAGDKITVHARLAVMPAM